LVDLTGREKEGHSNDESLGSYVELEEHGDGDGLKNESVAEEAGEEGMWDKVGSVVVRRVEESMDDEEDDDLEEIEYVEVEWLSGDEEDERDGGVGSGKRLRIMAGELEK
jgi:hypothetical protein